jgi:hypothetical protein
MNPIQLFIIGFMMLFFIWLTLIIEGKKGKKGGGVFKKIKDVAKKAGKTALSIAKDPSKGISLLKKSTKSKKKKRKKKRKKKAKKRARRLTPAELAEKCRLEWEECHNIVIGRQLDEVARYKAHGECYHKEILCRD